MFTEETKTEINKKLVNLSNAYQNSTPEAAKAVLEQFISENLIVYFQAAYIPAWEPSIRNFLYNVTKYYQEKKDGSVSFQKVAIKKIHSASQDKAGACSIFSQEIDILSELKHPHIVPLLARYRDPERFKVILVFKLLKKNLRDVLYNQGHPISETDRLLWALQLADALQYMHAKNILHRDIKSENVMLDENNHAVVIDFGLAITEEAQKDRSLVGTLFWMAPEIILGMALYSRNTDVYSFGMTICEMVTRDRPFGQSFPLSSKQEREMSKQKLLNNFTNHIRRSGVTQPIPPRTPLVLRSIMERCWEERRPTAREIHSELNATYEESKCLDEKISQLKF